MYINKQPIYIADTKSPGFLHEWADHESSLTDKLERIIGRTHLSLLSQDWITPTWWDKCLLKISDDLLFQREILMKSQNIDYWYARTIIPKKCYDLDPEFFKRLETESVKNLVFGQDTVQRLSKIYYPIDPQCLEYYWIKKYIKGIQGTLCVRLAEYSFQKKQSFYLAEILLPALGNLS